MSVATDVVPWGALLIGLAGCGALSARPSSDRRTGRTSVASVLTAMGLIAVLSACAAVPPGEPSALDRVTGAPLPDEVPAARALTVSPELAVAVGSAPLIDGWRPPADLPAAGEVTVAPIPGTVSGFDAGDAWIYLPPAYATEPRAQLPVLILMAGNPGQPSDWFDGGGLATTMDAYAADHDGLAPVVVVPDWLGTSGANPLCVDSAAAGNDDTYLTVDVHDWIVDTLQIDDDPRHWAVGGYSAGGTCALQLATRDPAQFPTVLAFSTQDHPDLETGEDTADTLFDGDRDTYDSNDPMALLADHTFADSAGFFVVGADDDVYRPQTEAVYDAAAAAGMDARYTILPGGHDFSVWSAALALALPWLGSRSGVTP